MDLLTFTLIQEREAVARGLMGAGEAFSFKGMELAKLSPLSIEGNLLIPNPLSFIYLKMISYRENSDRRVKDFVDIFELVVGLVLKNTILATLRQLAVAVGENSSVSEIKRMLKAVAEDSSPSWDYEVVENRSG